MRPDNLTYASQRIRHNAITELWMACMIAGPPQTHCRIQPRSGLVTEQEDRHTIKVELAGDNAGVNRSYCGSPKSAVRRCHWAMIGRFSS